MKQDVSKLYFLDGTLRKTKQADYSYMSLLKQGLSALGVNPADPGMVVTPDANTANYGSVFTGNFSLKQSLVYDNGTSVGIGTSSPSASYKVDIAGNVNFTGVCTITDYAIIGTNAFPVQWGALRWGGFIKQKVSDTGAILAEKTAEVVDDVTNKGAMQFIISQRNLSGTFMGFAIATAPGQLNSIAAGENIYSFSLNVNRRLNFQNTIFHRRSTPAIFIEKGQFTFTGTETSAFHTRSTTQGTLPAPRMTTAQRNLVTPVEGMWIYDTNLHKLMVYDGTIWQQCF